MMTLLVLSASLGAAAQEEPSDFFVLPDSWLILPGDGGWSRTVERVELLPLLKTVPNAQFLGEGGVSLSVSPDGVLVQYREMETRYTRAEATAVVEDGLRTFCSSYLLAFMQEYVDPNRAQGLPQDFEALVEPSWGKDIRCPSSGGEIQYHLFSTSDGPSCALLCPKHQHYVHHSQDEVHRMDVPAERKDPVPSEESRKIRRNGSRLNRLLEETLLRSKFWVYTPATGPSKSLTQEEFSQFLERPDSGRVTYLLDDDVTTLGWDEGRLEMRLENGDVVKLNGEELAQGKKQASTRSAAEQCQKNVEDLGFYVECYHNENGSYPEKLDDIRSAGLEEVPRCPAAGQDTYSRSYQATGKNFILYCSGSHHSHSNFPRYDSQKGLTREP